MAIMAIQSTMVGKMVHFNGKKLSFGTFRREISCHATQYRNADMQDRNLISNNFYEVLSLDSSKNIGLDDIKKAYRNKALEFHPDLCPLSAKEESTRRFLEIKTAYETLSDPISREIYDDELSLVDGDGRRKHRGSSGGSNGFSREVWQRQLSVLKKRSAERLRKKIH